MLHYYYYYVVYGACVVMVAPRIRFSTEILVYTWYVDLKYTLFVQPYICYYY